MEENKNRWLLNDLGEYVATSQDQKILTVYGDLGAAVLRVDDSVADLDVKRDDLASTFSAAARADCQYFTLLGLFFG
jgi:hypothetical protein